MVVEMLAMGLMESILLCTVIFSLRQMSASLYKKGQLRNLEIILDLY